MKPRHHLPAIPFPTAGGTYVDDGTGSVRVDNAVPAKTAAKNAPAPEPVVETPPVAPAKPKARKAATTE